MFLTLYCIYRVRTIPKKSELCQEVEIVKNQNYTEISALYLKSQNYVYQKVRIIKKSEFYRKGHNYTTKVRIIVKIKIKKEVKIYRKSQNCTQKVKFFIEKVLYQNKKSKLYHKVRTIKKSV